MGIATPHYSYLSSFRHIFQMVYLFQQVFLETVRTVPAKMDEFWKISKQSYVLNPNLLPTGWKAHSGRQDFFTAGSIFNDLTIELQYIFQQLCMVL